MDNKETIQILIEYNRFKEDKDYQNALILNQKLYKIFFEWYLDYCNLKRELVSKKGEKDSLERIEMDIELIKWNLEFLAKNGQHIVEYSINKSQEEKLKK